MFFHLRDVFSPERWWIACLPLSLLLSSPSSFFFLMFSSSLLASGGTSILLIFCYSPCFASTCSPCWPFPCRTIWSRRGGGLCCPMMIKLLSAMVNVLDDNRIIDGTGHCHFRLHSPLMLVYLSYPPSCTRVRKLIFCSKAPPPKNS